MTLNPGDRVRIIEKVDNWYRVRRGEDVEGWMEESTLMTADTEGRIRELAAQSAQMEIQNTATVRESANMRLEPGRTSLVIRRLESGQQVEVLERVSTPRSGPPAGVDAWVRARISPAEAGWILSSLIDFNIPVEISYYSEDMIYAAVKPIKTVEDPIAGQVKWYVVGERNRGGDPNIDFDGIRVFTWNLRKHRHETAYRIRDLKGLYPLEIGQDGPNPTFRVYTLGADGQTRVANDYWMNGVVVRPRQSPGRTPSR